MGWLWVLPSPIIANLYMEHFVEMALYSFPLKPKWWKQYVDDTNVHCPHGLDKLDEFHKYITNLAANISFNTELESDNQLPFLDVLLIKKSDGTLGRRVYCKVTHIDLHLHSSSQHHPSQKMGILKTLSPKRPHNMR